MKYCIGILCIVSILKAEAQSSALVIADSLYAVGNYTKAIENYRSLDTQNAMTHLQVARSYKAMGNHTLALESYKLSLVEMPDQPIAATEYGKLLITKGQFVRADTIFSKLSKAYPDNPEYFYQWGRALKRIKGRNGAEVHHSDTITMPYEKAFAKAVQLDSTHQRALFQLGLHYLKESEYGWVEKICFKALESDPENVEIINILAQNFHNRGFYTEAITWFEKLLALGQSNLFIHDKLGYNYYQENMYELAIEHYNIVLNYNDEDYGVHLTLAKLYGFLKDIEKAEYHAKQALILKDLPLDDVHYTLGRTYQINKKYEKAVTEYKRAINENPTHIHAHHGIVVCADNYYEDKKAVIVLYERFIQKFEGNIKATGFIYLSKERIKKLKKEVFLAEEKE